MLQHIQSILDKENFECSLIKSSDKIPYDNILVFIGTDTQNKEQILEIRAQEQAFSSEGNTDNYFSVRFSYLFPFQVEDLMLNQMASLIAFVNHSSEFPGFGLDELNNELYFRYVLLAKESGIDAKLLIALIGMIQLFLLLYRPSFERLAKGQVTLNELLEEVIEINQTQNNKK